MQPQKLSALEQFDNLPDSALVDVRTVAALKGVSVPTAWRWTRDGILPQPVRPTSGTTRWRVGDLRRHASSPVKS